MWCEAARLLPRAAAVRSPPCSLDAGCVGWYAGAHHGVVRGGAWAADDGGCEAATALARRGLRWLVRWRAPRCGARRRVGCRGRWLCGRRRARSTMAALACELARATVWCGVARLLPRAAAVRPPSCSLDAGCAGWYAGARHGVVRGSATATEGGGCEAATVLAQRGLCWLVRRRAPRCGARRRVGCRRRRPRGRHRARSTRAALASELARTTVWCGAARRLPTTAAARPPSCSLDAGCAGF